MIAAADNMCRFFSLASVLRIQNRNSRAMTEESCFPRMLMVANPQKEAENEQIIMGMGFGFLTKKSMLLLRKYL